MGRRGKWQSRLAALATVGALAAGAPPETGAETAAGEPALAERCQVAVDFLEEARAHQLVGGSWVMTDMPDPGDLFLWGRGGHWRGAGPPATTVLPRSGTTELSTAIPTCPDVAAIVPKVGGTLDGDLNKGSVFVSLPVVSANRKEAILHYGTTCGGMRVLCSGDFLAHLRRDRYGRWKLMGIHVMGD